MRGRRESWWLPALTAVTVVAGNAAAVAINAATDLDSRWPLGLDGIRQHPFRWAAGFTAVVVAAAVIAGWLGQHGRSHKPMVLKLRRCPPDILGIHPTVAADPAAEGRWDSSRLTDYVPRDHDVILRERLAEAARNGGFVLLVGASSTGKTRSAYEAALAVLPKWRLIIIDPTRGVEQLADFPGRTILWLDEVQKYLTDGGDGLTRGALLTLIHRHRAVILGTMWPDYYQSLVEQPGRDEITGLRIPDVNSVARDLLALAGQPIYVPDRLSAAERARATGAAAADPRVRAALDDPDVDFTQALAGAADLVRHWQQADRYARAVIDAAVDCRRLGVYGPLDEELLRSCASALLTVTSHTASVQGWFERAIRYATRELRGSTSVLVELPPVRSRRRRGGPTRRQYQLADYVFQHGQRRRFGEPFSEHFLKTLITRVDGGRDLFRVARSLHVRGLHGLAEQLYRRGGRAGDPTCRRGLALLLEEQGEIAEAVAQLAESAALGDWYSHLLRLQILSNHGDAAALADLAATDSEAAWRLAALLHARGDDDGAIAHLHRLWRAGVYGAAIPLADLLAGAGRYDDLARLAGTDCIEASLYLLASEDAVNWQGTDTARAARATARAQSLHPYGDPRLRREWLAIKMDGGRADEAVAALRELAAFGEPAARRQLCHLLADLDRVDELRAMADAGDAVAGWLVADLLTSRGAEDLASGWKESGWKELRGLAQRGNPNARSAVAISLARQGQAAEAARWLDVRTLARVLLAHGHVTQARRTAGSLATSAVPDDRLLWTRVLAAAGEREQAVRLLTDLAAAGEVEAGEELVAIAVAEGSEAELRRLACCGVVAARRALLRHLVDTGRVEEADRVRVHGLHPDGSTPQ